MGKQTKKYWSDRERAIRYQQALAGNPSYCTFPSYATAPPPAAVDARENDGTAAARKD